MVTMGEISKLRTGKGKTLLIIGAGNMGKWFANYFKDKYDVYINDIDQKKLSSLSGMKGIQPLKSYEKNITQFEMVINAVSLSSAKRVLRGIKENGFAGTVIDISTLKTSVNDILRSMEGAVSIHPFFGPGANSINGKTIALTPLVDKDKELKTVRKLFPEAKIVPMNEKVHDRLVCYSIELPQLLSLIAIDVLSEEMVDLASIEGTSYKALKMLIATSLYGSEGLARDIIISNVYTDQLLAKLARALAKVKVVSVREVLEKTASFRQNYGEFYSLLEKGQLKTDLKRHREGYTDDTHKNKR
ncbi:MAG: prephenate dehydrogenase/arogenate dehydrogenase family protein [Thaumarchaeota archaeon]|nr:prephenate dehydrogenase/arogenate dehydrogenase family protein [Nitrososphaerota archaeon]